MANAIVCSSLSYIVPLQEDNKEESMMIGKIRIVVDDTIIDSSLLYIVNPLDVSQGRKEDQLHGSIFGSNGIYDSSDHIVRQDSTSSLTRLRTRATKKRKTNYNNNISTKIGDDDSDNSNNTSNNHNNGNQDNCKRKRSSNKHETVWNTRLLELTEYEREFKHTNVPRCYTKNKPLGLWVSTQRNEYKHIDDGKPSPLTKERIESLNKLGFVWRLYKGKTPWDERLQQLIGFNNEFNHTNVPQQYATNKPLGKWVSKQRENYKFIEEGKPSFLTKGRIESLNKLGFVWKLKITWDERLQQLIDFNNEFNHTNVPREYAKNKPLSEWVYLQKYYYKLFEEGKPNSLTKGRIESLNKLGFVWRLDKGTHKATAPVVSSNVMSLLLSPNDDNNNDGYSNATYTTGNNELRVVSSTSTSTPSTGTSTAVGDNDNDYESDNSEL